MRDNNETILHPLKKPFQPVRLTQKRDHIAPEDNLETENTNRCLNKDKPNGLAKIHSQAQKVNPTMLMGNFVTGILII